MSDKNISNFQTNYRWGEKSSAPKLASSIDIARLREARSMLVDEPLFNFSFSTPHSSANMDSKPQKQRKKPKLFREDPDEKINKQTQINLQPGIESYIINTIKLNKILNSGLAFDQIDYFTRKPNEQVPAKTRNKKILCIQTDKDARICLKQFITVMSIHSGFIGNFNKAVQRHTRQPKLNI